MKNAEYKVWIPLWLIVGVIVTIVAVLVVAIRSY
jgi:uncharacterized membrane protein